MVVSLLRIRCEASIYDAWMILMRNVVYASVMVLVWAFIYASCFIINNLLLALSMMFLVFVLKFSLRLIVVPRYLCSSTLSMAALLIMTDGGSGSSR